MPDYRCFSRGKSIVVTAPNTSVAITIAAVHFGKLNTHHISVMELGSKLDQIVTASLDLVASETGA
jgi:hypothetical protein